MSEYGSPFSSVLKSKRYAAPIIHTLLAIGAVAFVFPLMWMLSNSLLPIDQVMTIPPHWVPRDPQWHNYKDAVRYIPFFLYLRNTLTICVLGVLGMVFSSALVAYSFARLEWPGRDFLFAILLGTMMIPFPVVMVPLYTVFKHLGWIGTLKPLWLPAFFGNAFNIFLLRQFFLRIPRNLAEAMALEGASEFTIFRRVYLPLAKPALAVVALFHFNWAWNDFMGPLLYLTDKNSFTLSLGLQQFQSQHGGTQWHLLMATSVLTVAPMVVLFVVTQKTFLQGITFMKNVDGH
jgi:multiple sugar transport system permease protein